MTTDSNNKSSAYFILIFISLIWGSSFILIKKALLVYSPEQVALLRIFFAYIALLPSSLLHLKKHFRKSGFKLAVSGVVGNLIPAFLFALAQTRLASGIAGVLNSLTPLFTLLIGIFLFNIKLVRSHFIGITIGLIGSIGLSLINQGGSPGKMNVYAMLIVVASFCYGFNVNYVNKYLDSIPSVQLTGLALFFVGPPSVFFLFCTDFVNVLNTNNGAWQALGFLAILGVVNTALALILFFRLLQISSPVAASSVTYIIPVVALLIGVLDGENIYFLHVIGMLMIISGVYLINRR